MLLLLTRQTLTTCMSCCATAYSNNRHISATPWTMRRQRYQHLYSRHSLCNKPSPRRWVVMPRCRNLCGNITSMSVSYENINSWSAHKHVSHPGFSLLSYLLRNHFSDLSETWIFICSPLCLVVQTPNNFGALTNLTDWFPAWTK